MLGGGKTFLARCLCAIGMQARHNLRNAPLEQPLPHRGKGMCLRHQIFDLYRNACPLCTGQDLLGGITCFFKSQQSGANAVTVHAHRNLRAIADQVLQNGHMLPGKVREPVYVEYMVSCKAAFFQLFQKLRLPIPGIPFAPGTNTVVAFQKQGKFLQLLGQTTLRTLGRSQKILGGDAAALKLINGIDECC